MKIAWKHPMMLGLYSLLSVLGAAGMWYMSASVFESKPMHCFVGVGELRCAHLTEARRFPDPDINTVCLARTPVHGDVLYCTRKLFNFAGQTLPADNKLFCTGYDLLHLTRPAL